MTLLQAPQPTPLTLVASQLPMFTIVIQDQDLLKKLQFLCVIQAQTYNTYLAVYTDCDLTTEIIANDDFCAEQSELTFESDGIATYLIMVEGAQTAFGDYTLEVTCEDVLGLNNHAFSSLGVYPNPVDNELFINNTTPITAVTIYTVTGQKLLHITPNEPRVNIDTDSFLSGVYFAHIQAGADKKVVKLIK